MLEPYAEKFARTVLREERGREAPDLPGGARNVGGIVKQKLYKYMGMEVLKKSLSVEELCSFKCSYPNDFNDPYELFLTIDFHQAPELLATYKDTIGELPQLPTTCFSKSPSVIPMWAHYAHNHSGVVVEFDEELFAKSFPDVGFGDVDYRDNPDDRLLDMLARACHIGKPRYHFLLHQGVFSSAYYTKHSCWSYEEERRLVAQKKDIKEVNGIMLLKFPVECISSIIVGQSADNQCIEVVSDLASKIGANFYEMKIGRSSSEPYFFDLDKNTYKYSEGAICKCDFTCEECKEPLAVSEGICSWCAINEQHEETAAQNNPLRMLDQIGELDSYYEKMMDIGRKHDK